MRRSNLLAGVAGLVPVALLLTMSAAHATASCAVSGLVGDGTTYNTTAIQNAINSCNSAGGGIVSITKTGTGVYLIAPIQLKSNVILQIGAGVTLLGTTYHTKYNIAYINWPWRAGEALISASGATNVGIIGSGTIDGQGGIKDTTNTLASWWLQAQNYTTVGTSYNNPTGAVVGPAGSTSGVSFYLQTTPLNYTKIPSSNGMPRPWLVEFYNSSNITIQGVTLKNSPMWHTVIRSSKNVVITGITVSAPVSNPGNITNADLWSSAKNSDAIDLIGAQNVTISNANLSVNDDNIAMKAFFPLNIDGNGTDPLAAGLITQNTTNVTVTNMNSTTGHGFSIGSETGFGVDHVLIQNVVMNNQTGSNSNFSTGIRLKSGRDRGSQLHHLTFQNITMTNVAQPLTMQLFYPASAMPQTDTGNTYNASLLTNPGTMTTQTTTANTPFVHDITISNVTATNATTQSNIEGLAESCMLRVTLNNVSIAQAGNATVAGLSLANVTGTFNNVSVTAGTGGFKADPLTKTTAAFQPYQNVAITGTGTNSNITAAYNLMDHSHYTALTATPTSTNGAYYSTPCANDIQQTSN